METIEFRFFLKSALSFLEEHSIGVSFKKAAYLQNTSIGVAGGCHVTGIALCSSHTRKSRKYDLPIAWGLLLATRKRAIRWYS